MTQATERADNIVPLPRRHSADHERALKMAGEVRRRLSLLQGYADLMEGLSPEQSARILAVMAEKIGELTTTLRPFLAADPATRQLDDYRDTRSRTRELITEYRGLLDRLHANVDKAHDSIAGG